MTTLVNEDLTIAYVSSNPRGSWLDATERDRNARKSNPKFFNNTAHLDRICAVRDIIYNFFKRNPNYMTARGFGRRPFETVKILDVGPFLNKKSSNEKNEQLYQPLLNLGNVEVISKHGHLTVRIY